MYGKELYGTEKYADERTGSSSEEYYTDLTPLVPPFLLEKKELYEIYHAQGYEVGYLQHVLEDTVAQCFIPTATWGLERWENLFSMETNTNLTYEQRREILFAKIRGQGTITVERIKEAAAAFSGGDVEIIEDNPHHRFIVRFIGVKGIPRNMNGFIGMLESIKPAHLAYAFEYRYTIWNYLKEQAHVWEYFKKMSWDELRAMKED